MVKKKKSVQYVSRGERRNVAKTTTKAMRRDYLASPRRMLNQYAALAKGKDVVFTIPNPNPNETSRPFIRQRYSGRTGKRV